MDYSRTNVRLNIYAARTRTTACMWNVLDTTHRTNDLRPRRLDETHALIVATTLAEGFPAGADATKSQRPKWLFWPSVPAGIEYPLISDKTIGPSLSVLWYTAVVCCTRTVIIFKPRRHRLLCSAPVLQHNIASRRTWSRTARQL